MLTLLLFSIPLSSYITLSVVAMILWLFFVVTKLQIDTATGPAKRTARPEPTPFSFFKPGENPAPTVPPSTLSAQELAISVDIDKGRATRNKAGTDKPTGAPKTSPPITPEPTEPAVTPAQDVPAAATEPPVPVVQPVVNTNPDFAEVDEPADFALYHPRQVSVVVQPPMPTLVADATTGELVKPTPKQRVTLKKLQSEATERDLARKRKTEQLMELVAGADFEAYVKLFRTYYEQAMARQAKKPKRTLYVIFAELIAHETDDVQAQLLMLLDKEPSDTEPTELVQADVYTEACVEDVEPAFT